MAGPITGGRCTATALLLHYGPKEPFTRTLCRQAQEWLKLWHRQPELRKRLRQGWHKVAAKLRSVKPRAKWAVAKGPMAALQLSLAGIGWQPKHPDAWLDKDGNEWKYDHEASFDTHELMQQIQADVRSELWAQAARHEQGHEQMKDGFDLTQLQRSQSQLKKEGLFAKAAALETVACGAAWTETRRREAGYPTEGLCPRCGKHPETLQHRLYDCEANDTIDDPWIQDSQKYCAPAIRDLNNGEGQMFWLRGLVPATWTETAPHLQPRAWSETSDEAQQQAQVWHLGQHRDQHQERAEHQAHLERDPRDHDQQKSEICGGGQQSQHSGQSSKKPVTQLRQVGGGCLAFADIDQRIAEEEEWLNAEEESFADFDQHIAADGHARTSEKQN